VERHRPAVPRLEDLIVADSYFSGHVAAAVAMYGSLAVVVWSLTRRPIVRGIFVVLAIVAPFAVALSRMYRGMHYASDVTVGATVGVACVVVGVLAARAGATAAARRRVMPEPGAVAAAPAPQLPERPLVSEAGR
jgi:undecaprenyl-diphosphatase